MDGISLELGDENAKVEQESCDCCEVIIFLPTSSFLELVSSPHN
jgi:hypothetical protein